MVSEKEEREWAEIERAREAHKDDVDVCPRCGKIYYGCISKVCLKCRCYTRPYESFSAKDRLKIDHLNVTKQVDSPTNIPKCPTCQSTNIKKISFAKGYLHWRMLGFFSKTAMSQWECKSCGHKW